METRATAYRSKKQVLFQQRSIPCFLLLPVIPVIPVIPAIAPMIFTVLDRLV